MPLQSDVASECPVVVRRAVLAALILAAIRLVGAAAVCVVYLAKSGSFPPGGIAVDLIIGSVAGALLVVAAMGIRRSKKPWGIVAAFIVLVVLLLRCLVTVFGVAASAKLAIVAGPVLLAECILTAIVLRGAVTLAPGWSHLDMKWHCGIVVAILLAAGAGFAAYSPTTEAVPLRKPFREFPNKLANYVGKFQKLSDKMEKAVGADEYLNLPMMSQQTKRMALVYATYNEKATGRIPHVPWVCMTAGGNKVLMLRQVEIPLSGLKGVAVPASALKDRPWMCAVSVGPILFLSSPTKGISINLLEFENVKNKRRLYMFQYFTVGGYYTPSRQVARFQAWWKGGYLAQAQVSVWLTQEEVRRLPLLDSDSGILSQEATKNPAFAELLKLLRLAAPELENHLPEGGTDF